MFTDLNISCIFLIYLSCVIVSPFFFFFHLDFIVLFLGGTSSFIKFFFSIQRPLILCEFVPSLLEDIVIVVIIFFIVFSSFSFLFSGFSCFCDVFVLSFLANFF